MIAICNDSVTCGFCVNLELYNKTSSTNLGNLGTLCFNSTIKFFAFANGGINVTLKQGDLLQFQMDTGGSYHIWTFISATMTIIPVGNSSGVWP